MAKVNFKLNTPQPGKKVSILVELYISRSIRPTLATGEHTYPENWNGSEVTPGKLLTKGDAANINRHLSKIKTDLLEIWRDNKSAGRDEIKAKAFKAINGDAPPVQKKTADLEQFIAEYIEKCRKFKLKKPSTINADSQTLDRLKEYCEIEGIELSFTAITMDFYHGFTTYLWDTLGHGDNTVGKHIKNLKTFMEESFDEDLHNNVTFKKKKFKKPGFKPDNVYLTSDEIVKIYGLAITGQIAIHRDLFVFNCWVGVRFGDLCKIRPEQIRQMSDGKYLQLITEKTGEDVTIPFHPLAEAIYSYYNNRLPAMSKEESVVYNRHLKTICDTAGIKSVSRHITSARGVLKTEYCPKFEMVSAHTARRSFATNCYKMGIDTMTIMAVTGHKTEKAFLRYICVTKEEHAKKMMEFFNKTPISNLMRVAN
jgi:site-specific recombinase XerD